MSCLGHIRCHSVCPETGILSHQNQEPGGSRGSGCSTFLINRSRLLIGILIQHLQAMSGIGMMCVRDNSDTERDSGRGWRISDADAERWFPVVIVIVMMLTQRADPWSRGQQTAEHFLSLTVTPAPADPPGDRR